MSDMVRIKIWATTDKIGSKSTRTVEFDPEDWKDMSDSEKDEAVREQLWRVVEWGWVEV